MTFIEQALVVRRGTSVLNKFWADEPMKDEPIFGTNCNSKYNRLKPVNVESIRRYFS